MKQEVQVLMQVTMWIDARLDEEAIGVLVRDSVVRGFGPAVTQVRPDKYLDILDIKQEAEIYSPEPAIPVVHPDLYARYNTYFDEREKANKIPLAFNAWRLQEGV